MPYYGDGAPYYYGSPFSNHSSLMTNVGRYYSPIAARYSPHLSTISETLSFSHRRRHGPVSHSATTSTPFFARPRRIIDTADIDVSKPPRSYSQDNHQDQQQRHRLRRDRPTIKIRSKALKDNPALREYNEKHEKTIGELLVEKFLIKDKQQQQPERKMRLYHQASLLRPDAANDFISKEEDEDILAAMRRRVTRRMTRRRSSADVIPLNPEQIEREAALLAAQAEALDTLVAEEQAEIEVEVRRGTFAKRHAMRLPIEISELSETEDDEMDEDERCGDSKKTKKKKRRKSEGKSLNSEDEGDEVILEIPESVIEEEEEFEWDDREKCDDLRDIVSSRDEVVIKINDVVADKNRIWADEGRNQFNGEKVLNDRNDESKVIANGDVSKDIKVVAVNEVQKEEVKKEPVLVQRKLSLDIIDAKIQETQKEIKDLICREKRFPELKRREKMLKLDESIAEGRKKDEITETKISDKLYKSGDLVETVKVKERKFGGMAKHNDEKIKQIDTPTKADEPKKEETISNEIKAAKTIKDKLKTTNRELKCEKSIKRRKSAPQTESEDLVPRFKIEACNSVGDFSTLYVKAANGEPMKKVEHHRESVRLPAPRTRKTEGSSNIETEVILPARKPYVLDTTRNSVYLALKPSQLQHQPIIIEDRRGFGADDGEKSIIIDETRKESSVKPRPAKCEDDRSKIESDEIISKEREERIVSDKEVVELKSSSRSDIVVSSADVKVKSAIALGGKDEFIAWWDETSDVEDKSDKRTTHTVTKIQNDNEKIETKVEPEKKVLNADDKSKKKAEIKTAGDEKLKSKVQEVDKKSVAKDLIEKSKKTEEKVIDNKEIKAVSDEIKEKSVVDKKDSKSALEKDVKVEEKPKLNENTVKILESALKEESQEVKSAPNEKNKEKSAIIEAEKEVKEISTDKIIERKFEIKEESTSKPEKKSESEEKPVEKNSNKKEKVFNKVKSTKSSVEKDKAKKEKILLPSVTKDKKPRSESPRFFDRPLPDIPEETQITSPTGTKSPLGFIPTAEVKPKTNDTSEPKNNKSLFTKEKNELSIGSKKFEQQANITSPGIDNKRDGRRKKVDAAAIMKIEKKILEDSDSPHQIRSSATPESRDLSKYQAELIMQPESKVGLVAKKKDSCTSSSEESTKTGAGTEIDFWSEIKARENSQRLPVSGKPLQSRLNVDLEITESASRKSLKLDLSKKTTEEKEEEPVTPLAPNQVDETTPVISQPATPAAENLSQVSQATNLLQHSGSVIYNGSAAREEEPADREIERTGTVKKISKWNAHDNLSTLKDSDITPLASKEVSPVGSVASSTTKKKIVKKKKSISSAKSSEKGDSKKVGTKKGTKKKTGASSQTSTLKTPMSAAGSPRNSPSQRPADLNKLFYTTPAILLTATPRDLRKVRRAKVKRKKPSTRTPSLSSDSTGSTRSTANTSTEEGSNEEDTEQKRLASTRSNDSGFDGSPRLSNCDMVCHKKCEKLTGNLCGLNQKLVAEALQALKKAPSQSSENQRNADSDHFHHSGRITPPATNLPRFKKYEVTDFNFLKVLGKGSFGKVLLAELRGTECMYAVKCLKKDVVLEDDDVECTLIERKVLTLATRHPYLCHLFCTFQTESHLFFVMEYLNGGDLMFHIQKSGRFSESRARFYAAEIWSGLIFLHKKGIVYRDLKLDNVLLDFEGHIRIADFGMCKLQIFLDRTVDTFCGTPDYMAPEIIKGLKYNQAVDWWSFGVLLYEMLTGQSPFSGCDEDELFWSICNERPFIPRYLCQSATELLVSLLEKDSGKRIPGHEIACHSFFSSIAWDKLERRMLEPPFKPAVEHTLDTRYFDTAFTTERPRLTVVPEQILTSMDQSVFRGFSYTNPNATD